MATEAKASGPVLELRGVTKTFPGGSVPAVENVSFALAQGEVLAILGPSGCGKTTTLRLIAGFETPEKGEVFLRGELVSSKSRMTPPEKRSVAMVFQDYALFPHLTVAKNVAFGLRKMEVGMRERRVKEVLELIEMGWLADRYPHQLSGGQQQRVALGRALAPNPVVVLLDEPFSNLDADMRGQMRREVHGILRRERATAIIVTHDQEEALSFADKVAVLNQGRIEQLGTPEEVYHTPSTTFVASFVGHASFIPAQVQGGEIVTEIGRFQYSNNHADADVVAMVRPHAIRVIPDERGTAIIVAREFQGARILYSIRLTSGWTITSIQPSDLVLPVGARVEVRSTSSTRIAIFPSSRPGGQNG